MTPPRLFVYGTLQDDELVRRLTGRRLAWRPAVLEGYARAVDPVVGYPVVRPRPGAAVDGRILEDVGPDALAAFDAYEGDEYRRTTVRVRTADGHTIEAYVYIPASAVSAQQPQGVPAGYD